MSPRQFSLYIMTEDTFAPCWEHGMEIPEVPTGLHQCGRSQAGSCPATMAGTKLPSSIQHECGQSQSSTDIMQACFEGPFSFSAPFLQNNLPPKATISEDICCGQKTEGCPKVTPSACPLYMASDDMRRCKGTCPSSVTETASFESLRFHHQAKSPFPVGLLSSSGEK